MVEYKKRKVSLPILLYTHILLYIVASGVQSLNGLAISNICTFIKLIESMTCANNETLLLFYRYPTNLR